MIRTQEAILLLDVSAPTFYKRVKKTGVQLASKTDSSGKSSYIRDEDLNILARSMGKTLPEQNQQTTDTDDTKKNQENTDKEAYVALKIQNTALSSKVEEYSGYVEIYKQQYEDSQKQQQQLNTARIVLMNDLLKVKVNLSTYKVLFYSLLAILTAFMALSGIGLINRN